MSTPFKIEPEVSYAVYRKHQDGSGEALIFFRAYLEAKDRASHYRKMDNSNEYVAVRITRTFEEI